MIVQLYPSFRISLKKGVKIDVLTQALKKKYLKELENEAKNNTTLSFGKRNYVIQAID